MLLPYRLLALGLRRNDTWPVFLRYQRCLEKQQASDLRIQYIKNCMEADIIPRFLRFRIPNNGFFDNQSVHEFQKKLLKKELIQARADNQKVVSNLNEKRELLKHSISDQLLVSVAFYSRQQGRECRRQISATHHKKLMNLSEEQEKPLFSVKNTVVTYELDSTPPDYVLRTLSLGPKNAVCDKFEPNDILAELDGLLHYCKSNNVDQQIISDINMVTLKYVKKMKKQKPSRNVMLTKRYLKENNLLAIPFDKGVGICIMKAGTYKRKLQDILELPQFEKLPRGRKNAKHPVLKEHERIDSELQKLRDDGKITAALYDQLHTVGSQPARLYGTAKVHKTVIPLRPVLSMPGSAYHKIADKCTEWLSVVDECKIQCSSKDICDALKNLSLEENEELVSYDVTSLYTNVPVYEAIEDCANMLYSGRYQVPPVDKETFVQLLTLCTCNVLMQTHDGFYRQVDGLAMGSPPAPLLANGWMSKYDPLIKGEAKLYFRYMDDIIREVVNRQKQSKLAEINQLDPHLQFTCEEEKDCKLPMLDMLLMRNSCKISSTWYNKPTDTGLVMNYHAWAPRRYKRAVVAGFVHRIYRTCSSWELFHQSLKRAEKILEMNQYPPTFYHPIIEQTITKIQAAPSNPAQSANSSETVASELPARMVFIQYRGRETENYCRALKNSGAPVNPILTLRKLKTVLPSLKTSVDHHVRSGVVYRITCPGCNSCYVGWTVDHICSRFSHHHRPSSCFGKHLQTCGVE